MTKPGKKRPKAPRPAAAGDDLLTHALAFAAGAILGGATAMPPATARCARCGHTRADHCGCGKTCLWQGPEEPDASGLPRRMLCACTGFETPGLLSEAPYGEGKLGELLDGLLRRKP